MTISLFIIGAATVGICTGATIVDLIVSLAGWRAIAVIFLGPNVLHAAYSKNAPDAISIQTLPDICPKNVLILSMICIFV